MANSKMILQNVRCAFISIDRPKRGSMGGKYSVQIILPNSDKQLAAMRSKAKDVALEEFGSSALGKVTMPFRNGDTEREEAHYKGTHYMSANSPRKPGIVNRFNIPATDEDMEELAYSGAYYHLSVTLFTYVNEGKKGVGVGLNHVMLLGGGQRLDGRTTAAEDFASLAESPDGFDDDIDEDFEDGK